MKPSLPIQPDALGNAKILLRKYLWRSFLTDRYEQAAATAALQDFRGLRGVLDGTKKESDVPILNEEIYPAPEPEQLRGVGWPKNRGILSRGVLQLSLKGGAHDIADETPISRGHIGKREYHHLFPVALLQSADIGDREAYRALNCALITWRTNRTLGAKAPLDYLRERSDAGTLGVKQLRARLRTHLIDHDALACGGYSLLSGDERTSQIREDYERFIENRARLIHKTIAVVWEGRELD